MKSRETIVRLSTLLGVQPEHVLQRISVLKAEIEKMERELR
jgi:uncharacterized small protein (DUF1192 family)